jgi:hypothetical protein
LPADVRRFSAILFLGVLLFNFYGYRLMIGYMQNQQAALLDARLEREQYNHADLISIKTPLPLPYLASSPDYERVEGSIVIDGVTYEYVKRRVLNDTLEILCLPNRAHTQLQSAENAFFRLQLQGNASQHDKQPATIKIALPDYWQEVGTFTLAALPVLKEPHCFSHTGALTGGYPSRDERPPQSMRLSS